MKSRALKDRSMCVLGFDSKLCKTPHKHKKSCQSKQHTLLDENNRKYGLQNTTQNSRNMEHYNLYT